MKAVFSKFHKNKIDSMDGPVPSTSTVKEDLPQNFNVRYLGFREAKGLWGIKHTRKPVDIMVANVKESKSDLHVVKLILNKDGCKLESIFNGKMETRYFPIETISYGVQDLVYTRVFAMIVVKEKTDYPHQSPFECHAFVCDSRQSARKLTYTLAAAFQEYSHKVRTVSQPHTKLSQRKRFAIDLRTPEEIQTELRHQDSEAWYKTKLIEQRRKARPDENVCTFQCEELRIRLKVKITNPNKKLTSIITEYISK